MVHTFDTLLNKTCLRINTGGFILGSTAYAGNAQTRASMEVEVL